MNESTFIGLDVHARSVWAGVLDGETGEVRSCARRSHRGAGPLAARPGRFARRRLRGRAHRLRPGAGLRGGRHPLPRSGALEIAPASGERVKTDRRDALRLARLLRLDELTAVRVPSPCRGGRP